MTFILSFDILNRLTISFFEDSETVMIFELILAVRANKVFNAKSSGILNPSGLIKGIISYIITTEGQECTAGAMFPPERRTSIL